MKVFLDGEVEEVEVLQVETPRPELLHRSIVRPVPDLPPAPAGNAWVEVTALGDQYPSFISVPGAG